VPGVGLRRSATLKIAVDPSLRSSAQSHECEYSPTYSAVCCTLNGEDTARPLRAGVSPVAPAAHIQELLGHPLL
jgi:hypothetical protein